MSYLPMEAMRRALALALAAGLCGCATMQAPSKADPFEPWNRAMYAIHEPIDTNIVRPFVQAYVDTVPRPVRLAISNFYNNIEDFFSGVNGLLQGKWEKAGNDFGRVTINSGMGLLGLIDIASDAGVERGNEDFGQTFGFWGIPQGPYFFVPLFGPTTVRDGTGVVIRYYLGPLAYIDQISVPTRNILYGIAVVDLRSQALQTQSILDTAALDRYTFIRRAYLQRRNYLVYDGKVPPEKEEDE